MVPSDSPDSPHNPIHPDQNGGTQLGKRYSHEESGLELLCVSAGPGTLAVGGEPLEVMRANPLPSSD
jgi:hypothetical protein